MAGFSHEDLIKALESRLDFRTARTVAGFALKSAGIAKASTYDAKAGDAILAGLEQEIGGRAQSVKDRLDAPAASAPAAKPAEKTAAKTAAKDKSSEGDDSKAADDTAPAKKAPAKKAAAKKS